ncbi:MAG: D-alanyl-D-alanine carboxypeptidase [Verrucomicrobia bacterium]|jgi:serine-type D-Ala-D-Ala carboxypeptidase (penicillin-binding protein 5/6)|nr:D-alanyl-D-alanine carboxypeptidase [Verrucomicrobiota bacterium]
MKALYSTLLVFALCASAFGARAPIDPISNDPYTGAIVVDVATGETLFEEGADNRVYPASVVKLMDLLLILERVEGGELSLESRVPVDAEAAGMGGSQVYLKQGEVFTLDEMLNALCIKSANDVAVALAKHIAGSKNAFVALMNRRASELGLVASEFASVHGLPPDTGQKPDVTTARDVARLALEVLKHPQAIAYTSTREKWFRDNTFQMLSHNRLLASVEGCDGLKTGYYRAAGFSIAATASRNGRRVLAVVMGCTSRPTRDAKARELLEFGFANLPPIPITVQETPVAAASADPVSPDVAESPQVRTAPEKRGGGLRAFLGVVKRGILLLLAIALAGGLLILILYAINRHRDRWKYKL